MLRPLTLTLLFALLLVPRLALAQEAAPAEPAKATAPTLARVDSLEVENYLLKIQQATIVLDKLKADFQTLINGLQKPGYQLTQGADGKLGYVIAEPKPESKADVPAVK